MNAKILVGTMLIAVLASLLVGCTEQPECTTPADCIDKPAPDCVGEITCIDGKCGFKCYAELPEIECKESSDCQNNPRPEVLCPIEWKCEEGKCVYECIEQTECETDVDCLSCTGVKSQEGYACMEGQCTTTPGPLVCNKECGAECLTDTDCEEGKECSNCFCEEKEVGKVSLSTDKTKYDMMETVRMTISNPLDEDICYYAYGGPNCNRNPFTVYWLFETTSEWHEFFTFQLGVNCGNEKEPFHCIEVSAKSEKQLSWDQTYYYKRKDNYWHQVPNGKYRLTMNYTTDAGEWEIVESDEFVIEY